MQLPKRLQKEGRTPEAIKQAARVVLAGSGLKVDDKSGPQYLLFLGEREMDSLAQLINRHWDALVAASVAASGAGGEPCGSEGSKRSPNCRCPHARGGEPWRWRNPAITRRCPHARGGEPYG